MHPLKIFVLFTIAVASSICSSVPDRMDSDQPDYELFYESLAEEYSDILHKSPEELEYLTSTTTESYAGEEEEPIEVEVDENFKEITTTESYQVSIGRLKCDNPWFWNTWKCVWLDWRNGNGGLERAKKNAKVAGILTGIISLFTICPICCTILLACYHRRLVTRYGRLIEKYMAEYVPGMIKLPNGKTEYYEPTPEEEEALTNLIEALSSVV